MSSRWRNWSGRYWAFENGVSCLIDMLQLINDESAGDVEMKLTASSRRIGTKKTEDLKSEL